MIQKQLIFIINDKLLIPLIYKKNILQYLIYYLENFSSYKNDKKYSILFGYDAVHSKAVFNPRVT